MAEAELTPENVALIMNVPGGVAMDCGKLTLRLDQWNHVLDRAREEGRRSIGEPVAWRYRWMDAMYGGFSDWDATTNRDAAVALAGKHGEVQPLYASSDAILASIAGAPKEDLGRPDLPIATPKSANADAAAPVEGVLPDDVVRLVIAGREAWEIAEGYRFEPDEREAFEELDKALEAFADRVPWENDPNDEDDMTDQAALADKGGR